MLIGYARTSKSDGSQVLDLQIDALKEAGVSEKNIYSDQVSGSKAERDGLETCLKAQRYTKNCIWEVKNPALFDKAHSKLHGGSDIHPVAIP